MKTEPDDTPETWTEEQARLYRRCFSIFVQGQHIIARPGAAPIPVEDWRAIAHNCAWTAAVELESDERQLTVEFTDGTVRGSVEIQDGTQ